jgi:Domain of unknown function (DUF4156)
MISRLCMTGLAVLLMASMACVSLSLAGEKVRITKHESDAEGCRFLGEVEARPPYRGQHDAAYTLRNEAAKLGGDVVVNSDWIGAIKAKVYDCGGKYSSPPE